jgi:hypothetical protein
MARNERQAKSLRWVQRTQGKHGIYYYFRRRNYPIVRLPGEPGSPEFIAAYKAALRATSLKQFHVLREHMRRQRQHRKMSPTAKAILIWAERREITLEQANLVARALGCSVADILRGREIVPKPSFKN